MKIHLKGDAMTTPSPAQQLANDISSMQSKLSSLQKSVQLADVRDNVEDLQGKIAASSQRIAALRQKGYVFEKVLEGLASGLSQQWAKIHPSINQQINMQAANLQAAIKPMEARMSQLSALARNPAAARPVLATLQSQVKLLEDKASAAERSISGMYDQVQNQMYKLSSRLDQIEFMLTNLAEASFQLLPTESGVAAVKAVWCKSGKEQKDDPQGILFLTDQRILFEQKQEVATKKVLFIATEKQKVQALQWEVPAALLDQVLTSKLGLMKNEDHLEIRFNTGASLQSAHLHIWQDCELWQSHLNRARSKDFDQDRVVAIDQKVVDKVKAAPTQCPSCGAVLDSVVLRGQDNMKCEYCGAVIRL
jgi:predicted  nucleic acid-binding Zn-ribbon protein